MNWAVIYANEDNAPWQVDWCRSEAEAKALASELVKTRHDQVVYIVEERFQASAVTKVSIDATEDLA